MAHFMSSEKRTPFNDVFLFRLSTLVILNIGLHFWKFMGKMIEHQLLRIILLLPYPFSIATLLSRNFTACNELIDGFYMHGRTIILFVYKIPSYAALCDVSIIIQVRTIHYKSLLV